MKRFFIKLAIFFIIGGTITLFLRMFAVNVGDVYKDGASIICEEKRKAVRNGTFGYKEGKINVLFMGRSKILAGIIPNYFDSLVNGRTYSLNLSLPALPIGPHYFALKDYLESNPPPEYIVLHLSVSAGKSTSLFDKYANQGISFPQELVSYFINRENKTVIFNFVFPIRMYLKQSVKYALNLVFNPSDIRRNRRRNAKIVNKMINDRGYYFIKEQARFPDNKLPATFKESLNLDRTRGIYDPHIDPYVRKFFDLASNNKIKILLIEVPYREKQYMQYSLMPKHYKIVLDEYSNIYIAQDGWKVKFYENKFFSDPTHLNAEGAELYTHKITEEFVELFDEEL